MQDRAAYFTLRLSYNFTALHLISHKHSLHYGTHIHTHSWFGYLYAMLELCNCLIAYLTPFYGLLLDANVRIIPFI